MFSMRPIQEVTRRLADFLAPSAHWDVQVAAVHRCMVDRRDAYRLPTFTMSRAKTFYFGENRRTDDFERMAFECALQIEEEKHERKRLQAAANRLAGALAAEGVPLDSRQLRALRRMGAEPSAMVA